ncbi:hypothetical protein OF83DRAFT_606758 [Amylostereum chailletii]|nr:hypothetical protein OF83DRAFT_606758 [Amylostereum chailletii]
MSSPCSTQEQENYWEFFQALFSSFGAESILFGTYLTLTIFSMIYLVSKNAHSRADYAFMGATIIMFATALTHWILHAFSTWSYARSLAWCTELPSNTLQVQVVLGNLQIVNSAFSDIIVTWRAWVLWGRPGWILITNRLLMLIGVSTFPILSMVAVVVVNFPLILFFQVVTVVDLTSVIDTRLFSVNKYITPACVAASAIINIWGTSLAAYKAWELRRDWRNLMGTRTRTFATNALLLVSGSGAIYNILWVVYFLAFFNLLGEANTAVQMSMIQVTGIYPTLVILLVFLEKKHSDNKDSPLNPTTLPWVVA